MAARLAAHVKPKVAVPRLSKEFVVLFGAASDPRPEPRQNLDPDARATGRAGRRFGGRHGPLGKTLSSGNEGTRATGRPRLQLAQAFAGAFHPTLDPAFAIEDFARSRPDRRRPPTGQLAPRLRRHDDAKRAFRPTPFRLESPRVEAQVFPKLRPLAGFGFGALEVSPHVAEEFFALPFLLGTPLDFAEGRRGGGLAFGRRRRALDRVRRRHFDPLRERQLDLEVPLRTLLDVGPFPQDDRDLELGPLQDPMDLRPARFQGPSPDVVGQALPRGNPLVKAVGLEVKLEGMGAGLAGPGLAGTLQKREPLARRLGEDPVFGVRGVKLEAQQPVAHGVLKRLNTLKSERRGELWNDSLDHLR